MTSKEGYENAKEKANKRLLGWISEIKLNEDTSSSQAQSQSKNTTKKTNKNPNKKEMNDRSLDRKVSLAAATKSKTKKISVVKSSSSNAPLSDIGDSNSSNRSSRLGSHSDCLLDDGGTRSRCPVFSIMPACETGTNVGKRDSAKVGNVNSSDLSKKLSNQSTFANKVNLIGNRRRSRVRGNLAPGESHPSMLLKIPSSNRNTQKRKKKKMQQKCSEIKSADDGQTIDDMDEDGQDISTVQKDSFRRISSDRNTDDWDKSLTDPFACGALTGTTLKERRQKSKEILDQFRRFVRKYIILNTIVKFSKRKIEAEEKSKNFKISNHGAELSFDASIFKSTHAYGGLTNRARQALTTNPKNRTEEDSRVLLNVLMRLPIFNKYPSSVNQDLATKVWYDIYENGRIIIKQGDPGSRMYFIVSGEIDLRKTDVLPTGEKISTHIQTLRVGNTFGELALIRNMDRQFTAICKGTSEFLSLSKDEFMNVLRSRWEAECNYRLAFLRDSSHFVTCTEKQLQMFADVSRTKEYIDNDIIIGDVNGLAGSVYFIFKGRCNVVKKLVVRNQSAWRRSKQHLPKKRRQSAKKPYGRSKHKVREEVKFLTITILSPGCYFGAGENLRDTFILARGKTECVIIDSEQFSIIGKSELLGFLKRDMENALPSNEVICKKFQENEMWLKYRRNVVREVINRRPHPQCVSYQDVPRSILKEQHVI